MVALTIFLFNVIMFTLNKREDSAMYERGNTIEFPKEFFKRIKVVATLENKKIRNFCMEKLEEILKEYEKKYGIKYEEKEGNNNG
jgi:DNA/RNA endonuclease G (NUC1)